MSIASREAPATTTDATMERSLATAIDSSVAAAAGGTLIWLMLIPPPQHQHHHRFQEHEPEGDEVHATGEDDVVAGLLDEFIPRDSDLDERILECPMIHRALLLAMASLQQEAIIVVDTQIIIQQLELQAGGEAYRDGGFGAVPAAAAAVASLGKRTFFHDAAGAGDDGSADHHLTCSICLDDFEDGDEIGVMPCSGLHEFHTNCVTKWLGKYSNVCPLCRHALPTGVDG
ncbi:unnamed protein product [Urochloa humidicola]